MSSMLLVKSFQEVFKGNVSAKGKTLIDGVKKESGKMVSKNFLDKSPLSANDILAHLEGRDNIGMMPITEEGKVFFGVIDVDSYSENVNIYVKAIYRYGMPLLPFYSKSKGLHLYVFFKGEDPSPVVDLLNDIRCILGLPPNTEIFPKQRAAEQGATYSWISLPYFDADNPENPRKLIKSDLSLAPLGEALEKCKNSARTIKEYQDVLNKLPLHDAPPCLQSIYLKGETSARNEYLFSLAVYYKTINEDLFDRELLDANQKLLAPLEEEEVVNTIIKSHERKTYTYKCGSPPLCLLCNKNLCSKREHGCKGLSISSLSYEEFTQYKTDPPYYTWCVNGQELKFFKEADIINQSAFRELCVRHLHVLPQKLKDAHWTKIVNTALENIVVKDAEASEDISTGGVFRRHINSFFTERVHAETKAMIKAGGIYEDKELKRYVFRGTDLLEYLRQVKNFKAFTDVEVQTKLKDLGCIIGPYTISDGVIIKAYMMPIGLVDATYSDLEGLELDFKKYVEKEGDEKF